MQVDLFLSGMGTITVLGSNGFVGREISHEIQAYLRNNTKDCQRIVDLVPSSSYDTDFFQSTTHQLLSSHSDSLGCRNAQLFIFAFGSGGFSLTDSEANRQIRAFLKFLKQFQASYPNATSIHISSLGAMSSTLDSAYKQLVQLKEDTIISQEAGCILRLPGIWGFLKTSSGAYSPRGVIGYLIDRTSRQAQVDIYAEMLTSRYYLNVKTVSRQVLEIVVDHLAGRDVPLIINLVPLWKLDINSLIALISSILDKPVPFRLIPGAATDRESHSLATLEGKNLFVRESFDIRIPSWPNYH